MFKLQLYTILHRTDIGQDEVAKKAGNWKKSSSNSTKRF